MISRQDGCRLVGGTVVDDEDLQVVSAVLQDALIQISDMRYLAAERRFVLVANRFCWENCSDIFGDMPVAPDIPTKPVPSNGESDPTIEPCRTYERVLCGLCFEGVGQVLKHVTQVNHVEGSGGESGFSEGFLLDVEAEALCFGYAFGGELDTGTGPAKLSGLGKECALGGADIEDGSGFPEAG